MIGMIKYDVKNPPKRHKKFLVYNGRDTFVAVLEYMGPFESGPLLWKSDKVLNGITHYAEINKPMEE